MKEMVQGKNWTLDRKSMLKEDLGGTLKTERKRRSNRNFRSSEKRAKKIASFGWILWGEQSRQSHNHDGHINVGRIRYQ